eukprot:3023397-Alexandrium_andersonii.AAC.1
MDLAASTSEAVSDWLYKRYVVASDRGLALVLLRMPPSGVLLTNTSSCSSCFERLVRSSRVERLS